jgi:hypothetical protein
MTREQDTHLVWRLMCHGVVPDMSSQVVEIETLVDKHVSLEKLQHV